MNCRSCARRISESIDGTLDRESRARVDEHLGRCSSCSAALREMEEALRLLREGSAEPAPAGLAERILLELASEPPASLDARGRRPGGPWTRIAAAAALLLALLAGLLAWQGRSIARRVAELESEVSGMRGRREAEKAELAAALERASDELGAARSDAERAGAALAAEATRRERLEEAVARLESAARAEADRAALVADDLRAERERAASLESELALLRDRALRRGAVDGAIAAAASAQPEPVVLRRRGGRLELETRGHPHVFIPRLFALARDESDPEIASLALDSLEGILGFGEPSSGGGAEPDPVEPGVGPVKWVRRGVAVLTTAAAPRGAPVEETQARESPRERRLHDLEMVWRQAAGAEG